MDKDEYFRKLHSHPETNENSDEAPQKISSDGGLKNIHTLKSDIADAIKKDGLSYSKIATAEAERQKRMVGLNVAPQKKTNILYLTAITVLVLFVVAGALYSGYVFVIKNSSNSKNITQNAHGLLSIDSSNSIIFTQIDKRAILSAIETERNKNVNKGDVISEVLSLKNGTSTAPLGIDTLLNIFAPNLGGQTARSFNNDYTFGFYADRDANAKFLLLRTDSYDDAYGGMISWEKYMSQDLAGFLVSVRTKTSTSSQSVASTTASSSQNIVATSTKIIPLNFVFGDEVVGNKDARVLKDTDGNTVFLYSFLDQHTLVLATSENTLLEIEKRIIAAQRVQ